ncbi:hypothetical protein QR680_018180 [Steinernema hermaphroditum]|uniref:G-protein coupled receptors family 1 profile domain-containing protein n=1 Tax=Steinernema hermaphroditum TaxID=289476 RepID=A0AA39LQP0_9BILA|nr:hypothetical protein QR680_018180 [Steinernema hermaphroditum]
MGLEGIEWCFYIAEGGLVSVFNIVVLLLILLDRKLRKSSELFFIAALCAADLIDSLAYFNAGVVRMRNILLGIDQKELPQLTCFYTSFVILFFYGYQLPALMITVVSLDRFGAVFTPSTHAKITANAKLVVTLCCFLWVTVFFGISAYFQHLHNGTASVQCYAADAFLSPIWTFIIGQRIVSITACVAIYIPIFFKTRKILNRNSETSKQQQRFNVTIGLTVLTALVLLVIPDTIVFFNIFGLANYHMLFYIISLNKCVVNVFVYTLRQKELKNKLICMIKMNFKIQSATLSEMSIIIRDATDADASIAHEFTMKLAAHCGSPNGPQTPPPPPETLREFLANKTIRAFLAVLDDRIVGYLAYYTAYSTWKGPFVMMEDLYVDSNVRGQKIGQRLLVHLGQWAKTNNFKRIKFECSEEDEDTMKFYRKFNATPVEQLHFTEFDIKGRALDSLTNTTFT